MSRARPEISERREAIRPMSFWAGELPEQARRSIGARLQLAGLDATHPGATRDDELLGQLWAHSLTSTWMADPNHPAKRWRDKDVLLAWVQLREAGGHAGKLRLTRAVAERQLDSTVDHASDRFVQGEADLDTLVGMSDGEARARSRDRA